MNTTLSGWPTLNNPDWDDPRLGKLRVPGTAVHFYGRKDISPYFVAFIADFHKMIRPLREQADCDGYDARPARNGQGRASDHYGGCAVDLLASGVGAQGSQNRAFWVSKQPQVVSLLKKYKLLYWGGDSTIGSGIYRGQYSRLIDPMHWYAKPGSTPADFRAEIARMRIKPDGTVKPSLTAHMLHMLHLRRQQ